jgi:MSHA pilin protein MshA
MRKINKQAGFTLIELIMVIVILGVLSAFALPRFADLGGNARAASINGLTGSLKAAANIAHAQQLANGDSGATGVTLEGTAITMIDGYPTADAAGIGLAAQVLAADYGTTAGGATAGATITYSLTPGAVTGTCEVVYTAATSPGAALVVPDTTTGTGC